MAKRYLLDTSALLAHHRREAGAERVTGERRGVEARTRRRALHDACGVGHSALLKSFGPLPFERIAISFVLLASGVGNNPNPVPPVRRTNGGSRYAMPLRIIPDLGHVSENGSQPSTKERCHVLQHSVSRSNHAKGSNHFPVESRTGSGKSGANPGE